MRVSVSLVAIISSILCTISGAWADYDSGYAAGKAAGKAAQSQLSSPGKINERIVKPMTSSDSPMRALGAATVAPTSGTQCPDGYHYNEGTGQCDINEFDGQISAPSSSEFLQISVSSLGAYDLSITNVRQDTDFDLSLDYAYSPDIVVSGICANGVVACDEGTWDNCTYYRWISNEGLELSLVQVATVDSMAGCYCVNASCGNPLGGNLQRAVDDLGAGAFSAISTADSRVTITRVENSGSSISYYGQLTTEAGESAYTSASLPFNSGSEDPSSYYSPTNGSDLINAGGNEASAQIGLPNSHYSNVWSTSLSVINAKQGKSCVIYRTINIDASDNPVLSTTDTCAPIEAEGCTIYTEDLCNYAKSECVQSVTNGVATGSTPTDNTTTYASPVTGAVWTFSANGSQIAYIVPSSGSGVVSSGDDHWWNIKRMYVCDAGYDINTKDYPLTDVGPTFLVKDEIDRSDHTQTSTSVSGNLIYYEEVDENGAVIPKTIEIQPGESVSSCEKACKLRKGATHTVIGNDAQAWEYQENTDSQEFVYRLCSEDACPAESGETIIRDCSCINEFPDAVSAMQAMKEAGEDIICSSD